MGYFLTDVKKIYQSKIVICMLIIMLFIMIADPISVIIINSQYAGFFEEIGANPFQFWLLMNSSSWGSNIYYTLLLVLPVISTGLVFYHDRQTSVYEFSITRNSKKSFFIAKVASVFLTSFINFFILLSINILVTYCIFSSNAPKTEQYQYLIPQKQMFSFALYQKDPLVMIFFYVFLNALVIALYTVLVLGIHTVIRLKNSYLALLIPYIIIFLVSYAISLLLKNHMNWNLKIIIQPRAASVLIDTITVGNVLISILFFFLFDAIVLGIGYIRNRDAL